MDGDFRCCRLCGARLPAVPAIDFDGMPAVAQHFPSAGQLAADAGVTLRVRQCGECGVVQLANEPVPYFREVIRASAGSPEMMEFRRRQFAEFRRRHRLDGKRLLEAGCGAGEYLALFEGVEAFGLEYGAANVAAARKRGLAVMRGYAGDGVPGGPYDAFAAFNCFEHLPDLRAVLTNLRAALVPGGVALVEVPNFDAMRRRGEFNEFTTDHLFYFSAATLAGTLRRFGFDVLECREEWYGYILNCEVRRGEVSPFRAEASPGWEPLAPEEFTAPRGRLVSECEAFLKDARRSAVWGAGHQALATIAMTGIAPRIAYVVDSAPFKQGLFTPATHLPIVAPEELRHDPVDTVIVMAAGYSDEVLRILRREFPEIPRIAVLREGEIVPAALPER